MPWLVGIDEAGYGPNLGPLVMTAVACRLPEGLVGCDLWKHLRKVARRRDEEPDERLLIEDSKFVYSPGRGLGNLEKGVLGSVLSAQITAGGGVHAMLASLCPESLARLSAEAWYRGLRTLPICTEASALTALASRFSKSCERLGIQFGPVDSVVFCSPRYNELLDFWGSKGAVLGQALAEILRRRIGLGEAEEAVVFQIDKHGGRNTYAAMLQDAIADGMVVAHEEGADRSCYSVLGLPRHVRVIFEPRADSAHFCVALASMVSKYVRELLMLDFNDFWASHVPGVRPTAGYPGDSARFFDAIRTAAERLSIPEEAIWRKK
jgi:ribonuclease HII